jgi:hypothetical protein
MIFKCNKNFERRAFLWGVGGAVLALPARSRPSPCVARRRRCPREDQRPVHPARWTATSGTCSTRRLGRSGVASMKAADRRARPATAEACRLRVRSRHRAEHRPRFRPHPGCGHPRGNNIALTASAAKGSNPGQPAGPRISRLDHCAALRQGAPQSLRRGKAAATILGPTARAEGSRCEQPNLRRLPQLDGSHRMTGGVRPPIPALRPAWPRATVHQRHTAL